LAGVELLPLPDNGACVMSAGRIFFRTHNKEDFVETFRLKKKLGEGKGIRHDGLLIIKNNIILLGEYTSNRDRVDNVRILRINNKERTWDVPFNFAPGRIRHIHSIQKDPYTDKIWICTGDKDNECMVIWSDDNCRSINPIGQGGQEWRVTQLAFTKDALFWGADSPFSVSKRGLYRWDREKKKLTKLISTPQDTIFFATMLDQGTIVMSSVRNGLPNEQSDKTCLWIIKEDLKIYQINCGTWDNRKDRAMLRFQRSQGDEWLAVTVFNQKELGNGDLLLIHEKVLSNGYK